MIKVLFFLDFKNDFAFLGLCEFHRNSQGCGLISKDRLEVGDKRLEKKQTSDRDERSSWSVRACGSQVGMSPTGSYVGGLMS